jgi:myo-inositol-1(or 4)-monophosphatase
VSVALVEEDRPVLGCVFAPVTNEFFFAAKGHGTTRNNIPIRADTGTALDSKKIAGPKPLIERLGILNEAGGLHPRIGSLALRLVRVADGTLDAAFAGGNSRDWDLAAADLIVHEAGGGMTALTGEPLIYNGADVRHGLLVAAGRLRHKHIVERFRTHLVS